MSAKTNNNETDYITTNIRKQISCYINTIGINDPKTLGCMIQLADRLQEIRDKSEEIQLEVIKLYQTAIEFLTDVELRIKTKLKLSQIYAGSMIHYEGCNSIFFRDLINDSSIYYGRDSQETFQCVELYLQSYEYEKEDINDLFNFFEIAKANNYDLADYDFADFLESHDYNDKALEIKLYYLELQNKHAPLWHVYFENITPLDICNLYIDMCYIHALLDMLVSIRNSVSSIPSCFPEEIDKIDDYDKILKSLNCGISEIIEINNKYPAITSKQLRELTSQIMRDVFPHWV
jgi:hypothetical protein